MGRAAVGLLLLLAVACVPSSDERAHDAAVRDLQQRVEAEDGWIVLDLPNIHEGGGITTWWLHPCDVGVDDERDVVRTAYHGSDVAGLDGVHAVEHDTLACSEPTDRVMVAGRELVLDVEVVSLGHSHALLEPRDELPILEVAGGEERVIVGSSPARGTCDGWTSWTGSLTSEREVHLSATSCVGTIAALPDPARGLLGPIDGDPSTASAGPLREGDRDAFVGAVEAAGWEADQITVHTFEGTTREPIWRGPCGVAPDDEHVRSTVSILDGQVVMTSDACEP